MTAPSYRVLADGLRAVIAQPELLHRLKNTTSAPAARAELGIDEDLQVEILNILNELDLTRHPQTLEGVSRDASPLAAETETASVRTFAKEAFAQVRRAYQISVIMSSLIFVIGVGFLLLAAWNALARPDEVTTTAVVAGTGLVPLVTLFYRNPLAHIAQSVSNAQRAKIIVTSYVVGLGMLSDQVGLEAPTDGHLRSLADLTTLALDHLSGGIVAHDGGVADGT